MNKLILLFNKYKSLNLLTKISFWITVLSFFVSIKMAIILCVISGLIAIVDKTYSLKKPNINDVIKTIKDKNFKEKLNDPRLKKIAKNDSLSE